MNQLASELPTKPQIPVMKSFIARADNEVRLRNQAKLILTVDMLKMTLLPL